MYSFLRPEHRVNMIIHMTAFWFAKEKVVCNINKEADSEVSLRPLQPLFFAPPAVWPLRPLKPRRKRKNKRLIWKTRSVSSTSFPNISDTSINVNDCLCLESAPAYRLNTDTACAHSSLVSPSDLHFPLHPASKRPHAASKSSEFINKTCFSIIPYGATIKGKGGWSSCCWEHLQLIR